MGNLKLSELSKKRVIELFEQYFTENFPEKLKFNPTLIEYNDDNVKFGMWKHHGVLNMGSENLIKIYENMESRFEQNKTVLKKWDELIFELDKYLSLAKKTGGTLSHKVGSMRDKQIELRNNFE
ncbi:hypothetical protein E1J38_014860 [Seonamhaeicola sediminis]|uniref:Uncharacterized protein n=1 Tax=Seonamhaeicola sediminis TaxID=2528206 RepID=A0A562Y8A7_9FLAO|nr:hypothetical protein [Seonamhaeicola sediminis]TWO30335.1 hypothetical protein E1J38_014860 [Seonamhaeicola sediminis]